jgi:fibronectin type 3 domain-containing protein
LDNGSAITGYNIYRGTASGSTTLVASIGTNTTFSDLTVTNNVTYYYNVTAVNAIGEGASSNEVSATPVGTTPPSAPRNLGASPQGLPLAGFRAISLSWQVPTSNGGSAITQYKVYRGSTQIGTAPGNALTYTDSTVTPGTTYSYHVTAVNAVAEGPASNTATATA